MRAGSRLPRCGATATHPRPSPRQVLVWRHLKTGPSVLSRTNLPLRNALVRRYASVHGQRNDTPGRARPARIAAASLADQPRPARALRGARRRALLARAALAPARTAAALDHPARAQAHPRPATAGHAAPVG